MNNFCNVWLLDLLSLNSTFYYSEQEMVAAFLLPFFENLKTRAKFVEKSILT